MPDPLRLEEQPLRLAQGALGLLQHPLGGGNRTAGLCGLFHGTSI